jgi:hypothetical protein
MLNGQFNDLLQLGLNEIFTVQKDELAADAVRPVLYAEEDVDWAYLRNQEMGGLGNMTTFNGAFEYDSIGEGYQITYNNGRFAIATSFSADLAADDLYGQINKIPAKMALSAMRTMEIQGASIFNHAFDTNVFTGGDSQALCYTAHTYRNSSAATQSNSGTLPLTYDNLIATRKNMKAFTDDRGQLIRVMPDLLLVPRGLEDVAISLTQSPDQPNTANRSINPIQRFMPNLSYIAWDYLTDSNNWFLIDSRLMKLELHWYMREAPNFAIAPDSEFNKVYKVRTTGRWSFGFDTWSWIYGQNVA